MYGSYFQEIKCSRKGFIGSVIKFQPHKLQPTHTHSIPTPLHVHMHVCPSYRHQGLILIIMSPLRMCLPTRRWESHCAGSSLSTPRGSWSRSRPRETSLRKWNNYSRLPCEEIKRNGCGSFHSEGAEINRSSAQRVPPLQRHLAHLFCLTALDFCWASLLLSYQPRSNKITEPKKKSSVDSEAWFTRHGLWWHTLEFQHERASRERSSWIQILPDWNKASFLWIGDLPMLR